MRIIGIECVVRAIKRENRPVRVRGIGDRRDFSSSQDLDDIIIWADFGLDWYRDFSASRR
jgi:hypothetical protein